MKKISVMFLSLFLVSVAYAEPVDWKTAEEQRCASDRAAIETQLEYAKKYNNQRQIRGLESALAGLNERCTDAGLLKEREKDIGKYSTKIQEKEEKIKELELDEQKALRKGDQKKISRKQQKLKEERQELELLRSELERLEKN